jgi:hypothetical protein
MVEFLLLVDLLALAGLSGIAHALPRFAYLERL